MVGPTVASFSISWSLAPREARPISWENWAKLGSAKIGAWPINSWRTSLGWAGLLLDRVWCHCWLLLDRVWCRW